MKTVGMAIDCINLFQPWADAIVSQHIPVLIRRFRILKRGCIGIAATERIDDIFLTHLTDIELKIAEKYLKFGSVIGTVDIEDCIKIDNKNIFGALKTVVDKIDYDFYPAHLVIQEPPVYFWIVKNPIQFKTPVPLERIGIRWSRAIIPRINTNSNIKNGFWDSIDNTRYVSRNIQLRKYLSEHI
jgi:hypothetical protein